MASNQEISIKNLS